MCMIIAGYMAKSVDPEQTDPLGGMICVYVVCSGTLKKIMVKYEKMWVYFGTFLLHEGTLNP